MSSGSLGSLVVNLEANIARFTSDMGRASQQTEQAMNKISGAVNFAKGALGAIGVALSAGALVSEANRAISALADLDDMAQKTGSSVENLSKLSQVAAMTGVEFGTVDAAIVKLAKNLTEVDEKGSKTSKALQAIGISTKDIKNQDPAQVFVDITNKLQNYEDGAGKVALAQQLMGKSGAQLLPYMNDVAENIDRFTGATTEAAQAASKYQDDLGRMKVKYDQMVVSIVSAALPATIDFMGAMSDVSNEVNGVVDINFSGWADNVALVLARMADGGILLARTFIAVGATIKGAAANIELMDTTAKNVNPIGAAKVLLNGGNPIANIEAALAKRNAAVAEANEGMSALWTKPLNAMEQAMQGKIDARAYGPTSGTAAGPAKKTLTYSAGGAGTGNADSALLAGKLRAIEDAYRQEQDVAKFHEAFMRELRDQEIVDLRTYSLFKVASTEQSLESAQRAHDAEIAVLRAARAEAEKDSDRAAIDNQIGEAIASRERAIQNAQQDRAMQTLELSAAQSELNNVTKEWIIQQQQAASQFQFEIDMMGKSSLEVAKLTAARRIYLDVEEQIRQAQKNSAVPIDRTAFDQQRDTAIAASNSLYDQADTKQRDPWFNMQESIRRYGEEANNVGASIGNSMRDAFQGAEDAFVEFTTTGRLSFSGLATSILADIARIMARKAIAGLVNMAVGSFSGGSSPSSGPGSTGWDGYGNTLAGARANGGPVSGGSSYLVGERGPEIFTPRNGGTIIPNHALGGSSGITINTSVNVANGSATSQTSGDASSSGRALSEMVSSMVKDVVVREMRQGGAIWTHMNGRA